VNADGTNSSLMRVPRVQLTVGRMMIVVILFAVAFFTYEQLRRSYSPALDRNSGRFLVLVKVFRGSSASSDAKSLAAELRYRHGLPAYTLATRDINRGKKGFHGADDSVAVFIGRLESLKSAQATAAMVRRSKAVASVAGRLSPVPTTNPYLPVPRSAIGSTSR
jgi:hypothetical protein